MYLPAKYQLNSTSELQQILKTTTPQDILRSLDVESLFTNVPDSDIIHITIQEAYSHTTKLPSSFSSRYPSQTINT